MEPSEITSPKPSFETIKKEGIYEYLQLQLYQKGLGI